MALTRETMTDEQRRSVAIEYLKAFDRAGVTSDGGSILDLFADDAQVYFPKWGVATGKEQIGRWCDVFEIRDWQIQRCFIYLDPDYAGQDTERYPWLGAS